MQSRESKSVAKNCTGTITGRIKLLKAVENHFPLAEDRILLSKGGQRPFTWLFIYF